MFETTINGVPVAFKFRHNVVRDKDGHALLTDWERPGPTILYGKNAGKPKVARGFMQTVCYLCVLDENKRFTPAMERDAVLDYEDALRNLKKQGGDGLDRLTGKRRALDAVLKVAVASREERRRVWDQFEASIHEQRAENLIPQLEGEISHLINTYLNVGGNKIYIKELLEAYSL